MKKESVINAYIAALEARQEEATRHPMDPSSIKWALEVFVLRKTCGERVECMVSPAAWILDKIQDEELKPVAKSAREIDEVLASDEIFSYLAAVFAVAMTHMTRLCLSVSRHPPGG